MGAPNFFGDLYLAALEGEGFDGPAFFPRLHFCLALWRFFLAILLTRARWRPSSPSVAPFKGLAKPHSSTHAQQWLAST
jgi:hypothetical protein